MCHGHVSAHAAEHGERLQADGARRLPRVLLHVLGEVPAVAVGDATGGADVGTAT